MGALDVCPFVPVRNVSMEECVTCAHIFGQRLAAELGVPGEWVRNLSAFHPTLNDSNCWRKCQPVPGGAHPQLCLAVYLYGAAARDESRKALPSIRAGEYEALPKKVSLAVAQAGQT